MKEKKVQFTGYEVIERVAKPIGNSAHIAVPKSWINKRVAAVLLEEREEKGD